MALHMVVYLVQFVAGIILSFFARSVEVFLREPPFGLRYLYGKGGTWLVLLHVAAMLGVGVFLTAPFEVAQILLAYDPDSIDIEGFVRSTRPTELDLRDRASQTLEAMKDTYVVDEGLSRFSIYSSMLTELAFRSVTIPYAAFVLGVLLLSLWHHVRSNAEDVEEVPIDHRGASRLAGLFPWLHEDQLSGVAEPVLVVVLGLVCWGQLPGSRVTFPYSLNADQVLGHALLMSGVCLGVKERMRQAGVLSDAIEGYAATDSVGSSEAEFVEVVANRESLTPFRTLADVYAGLPEHLLAMMSDLPPEACPAPAHERVYTADDSEPEQQPLRIACPSCGKRYRITEPPERERTVKCVACKEIFRFGQFEVVGEATA